MKLSEYLDGVLRDHLTESRVKMAGQYRWARVADVLAGDSYRDLLDAEIEDQESVENYAAVLWIRRAGSGDDYSTEAFAASILCEIALFGPLAWEKLMPAVKEYAAKHYNEGGWDTVIEAYEDHEIAAVLEGCTRVDEAIKRMGERVGAYKAYGDEIRAEADYGLDYATGDRVYVTEVEGRALFVRAGIVTTLNAYSATVRLEEGGRVVECVPTVLRLAPTVEEEARMALSAVAGHETVSIYEQGDY